VRWWPKLIDTLFKIKAGKYPQGWGDHGKLVSDHNNYDVVELFYRAWNQITPQQRQDASAAVGSLLKWCLAQSVTPNGDLVDPDKSDPIPDSFYYAASFLDTIGYFEKKKRFWTSTPLPGDPAKIRAGIIAQLKRFNPYYTEIDDTLFRLRASEHPWTNAIL